MTESSLKNDKPKFTPELPVEKYRILSRFGRIATVTGMRVSVLLNLYLL